jgi:hypothetical protein
MCPFPMMLPHYSIPSPYFKDVHGGPESQTAETLHIITLFVWTAEFLTKEWAKRLGPYLPVLRIAIVCARHEVFVDVDDSNTLFDGNSQGI